MGFIEIPYSHFASVNITKSIRCRVADLTLHYRPHTGRILNVNTFFKYRDELFEYKCKLQFPELWLAFKHSVL